MLIFLMPHTYTMVPVTDDAVTGVLIDSTSLKVSPGSHRSMRKPFSVAVDQKLSFLARSEFLDACQAASRYRPVAGLCEPPRLSSSCLHMVTDVGEPGPPPVC